MSQTKTQLVEGLNINTSAPADALVVDNSGRVGIGNTDPGTLLTVGGSAANGTIFLRQGSNNVVQIYSVSPGGAYSELSSQTETQFRTEAGAMRFATVNTERARIDSSGRLLVGTSSAISTFNYGGGDRTPKFQLSGDDTNNGSLAVVRTQTAPNIIFGAGTSGTNVASGNSLGSVVFTGYHTDKYYTGGFIRCEVDNTPGASDMPGRLVFSTTADGASSPTERIRITSGGDVLLGTTNSGGATGTGVKISAVTGTNNPWVRIVGDESTGTNFFLSGYNTNATNNGYRFYVKFDGGIVNHSGNNVNLCDEREKKNIETLDSTWGCLKNWELKKFHYNGDADTDDKRYGVIAQQVASHCPEVITDWVKQKAEDAVLDDDGNVVTPAVEEVTRMGVKEQQMMWMAIKALQEAQTRIETLETANASQAATIAALDARLTALEGA